MKPRLLAFLVSLGAMAFACGKTQFPYVDAKTLVYQEGDLPADAGSVGVQTVDAEMDWAYDKWAGAQIAGADGEILLAADVIVFTDKRELQKAYAEFLDGDVARRLADVEAPDIGETIVGKKNPVPGQSDEFYLQFRRCYALVTIYALVTRNSGLTEESVYRYAGTIDQRLIHSVCPI